MTKTQKQVQALIARFGSPAWVAAEIGVSTRSVERWAAGLHHPTPLAQRAIERLLAGKRFNKMEAGSGMLKS